MGPGITPAFIQIKAGHWMLNPEPIRQSVNVSCREAGAIMFKYGTRAHIDGLLNMGSMRIGTLYDYRRIEHARGVVDATEGTKTLTSRVSKDFVTDDAAQKEAFRKAFGVTVHGKITAPAGVKFENKLSTADFYLLCFSKDLNKSVQSEFDGAEACAEITDPNNFFDEVTRRLNLIEPVTFQGVHAIKYTARDEKREIAELIELTETGLNPALIKELSFAPQQELRAIWTPNKGGLIQPKIIAVPTAVRYVRDVTSML